MRYIDNSQLVRLANLNEINQAKLDIAALAEEERSTFIDNNGTIWSALKPELWRLGNMKCWYSEAMLQQQEGHVEHYRPKKKPHGLHGEEHPGYWWRAFDWTNFRISHPTSNVRITDYLSGEKVGKGAYFPLQEDSPRALTENDEVTEVVVLLDPTIRGDCRLIIFDTNDGKPIPRFKNENNDPEDQRPLNNWKNKRAKDSIAYYHLDEGTWNFKRKDLMDDISKLLEAEIAADRDQQLCDELTDELIGFVDEHKEFTSAAMQTVKEKGLLEAVA